MVVLLFLTLDIVYYAADVTCIATTIDCESESFNDLCEDISNEDANFEKALFVHKHSIKITLPAPSFVLVSELTNQVWQPPQI